jgi:hypothetical protein
MLFVAKIKVAMLVTVDQCTSGDHFGIQPSVACDLPMKHTAVSIGPIHHGGNRQTT